MKELDCSKIYSREEIRDIKPSGYLIIEKNYKTSHKSSSYNRYRIIGTMKDVNLIEYNEKENKFNNCMRNGIIFIEMVNPESE